MADYEAKEELCELLGGLVDYLAQFVLLLVALGGLWYKRVVEVPKRPVKIWALDVSKQAFSGLAGHLCNMITAMIVSMDISHTSECSWYFVVFTIDTICGVFITLLLHKILLYILRAHLRYRYSALPMAEGERRSTSWVEYVVHCGEYGDPPSFKAWAFQMAEWVFVTIVSRCICGSLIYVLRGFMLVDIASTIDELFVGRPHLLLFTVMVLCPVAMNLIQVWIQDNILKWKQGKHGLYTFGLTSTVATAIMFRRKQSIQAHRVTDIEDEVLDEES